MKGIVLEITGGKAVVMKNNGEFLTVDSKIEWKIGDVITIRQAKKKRTIFYGLAACMLLFISLGFTGQYIYFQETTLVSIDVNPSIELSVNRFQRVIGTTTYNEEGAVIVSKLPLTHKTYAKAVALLAQSQEFEPYLKEDSLVYITVQAEKDSIYQQVKECIDRSMKQNTAVSYLEYDLVDKKMVEDAHQHGVTAGKYKALLELEETDPSVDIKEYSHCTIKEIKEKTTDHKNKQHHRHRGNHE